MVKRQIFQTAPTIKEVVQQLTANSLLTGRESIILTIAKGDKSHNNQDNVNSDDSSVYQINQQLKGGVETEAAKLKKVSYTAVTCSSYAYI